MGNYPPPGFGASGVGRRIEEAIELIEMELRGAVMYVNNNIVPQVRRESITAMRTVADTLRNLADRFEQSQAHPAQAPPQTTARAQEQSTAQATPPSEDRQP